MKQNADHVDYNWLLWSALLLNLLSRASKNKLQDPEALLRSVYSGRLTFRTSARASINGMYFIYGSG